ncbi:MAG TPA: glycosyltransferase family 4 protein [Acidimicrobiales bacterium]|nr:glycosyltransferase family 4 protein [Acidimicrobiales bacterium]
MTSKRGRLAFVTPRYGDGVVGGSELVMAEAARGLAARGFDVEVLTTCARDHYTWANDFPAGVESDRGLTIRRFPTEKGRRRQSAGGLLRRPAGPPVGVEAELAWVDASFSVPDLYDWLRRHGAGLDLIVFSPYLFWTTIHGASVLPEKSVVMPCLHDERDAYMSIVSTMLSDVAGVWFLSEPEHQLGHKIANLPPHHPVVGAAVDVPDRHDADGFRERHGLRRPFVLYAGRREDGKGWRTLVTWYGAALMRYGLDVDLVTVGVGEPFVPSEIEGRVVDLGYLDPDELPHAFAAASAYVQPSRNESFSRTVMESWLAGTPVIATSEGSVVAWHCERSGGGLTYGSVHELAECLRLVAESPDSLEQLAKHGREYVLANYTWPVVLDQMERSVEALT